MRNIEPKNLTVDQLAKVLKAIPDLKAWISAVEDYALSIAQEGTEVPGFELGTTRPSRIWTEESGVIGRLAQLGKDIEDFMPRSLLSVAQTEKLIGKKEFAESFSEYVGSTTGNPKLIQKV